MEVPTRDRQQISGEDSDLIIAEQHLRDLRSSGLSEETIYSGFFRSVNREEAKDILDFDPGSPGLAFVFPGTNGIGLPYVRVKPDNPFVDEKGRKAKYLTAKNAGNRLYVPACYDASDLKDVKRPMVLTEGEKKACKGAQELDGFVVLGLAGVWCFKTKDKPLIDDLKRIPWRDRQAYITYDSDVVTKREVWAAENVLAAALDKLGAQVNICRIPTGEGGAKQGLDDYLISHSPEVFIEDVLDRALIWTPRGTIAVESATELEHKTFPHLPEVIGCGILPPEAMLVISAYSKMGKSVMALMIGICVASGKSFLNQFPVDRRWKVLYFQMEISAKSVSNRLKKMLSYARQQGSDPGSNFDIVNMPPIKVDNDAGLKTAMRIIRARRPDVVIWDPLYKLHSGDENKSDRMQRVLDKFDYIRSVFKVAQIIVHHHGKPQKDSGRDGFQLMRGSSVFDAFADTYLTLLPHKKEDKGRRYQRLSFTLRNDEAPEDLIVDRNPENLWYEVVKEADRPTKISITDVVNTLMLHLGGRAKRQDLIDRVKTDLKVSERTAVKVITDAVELQRIGKETVGREVEFHTL